MWYRVRGKSQDPLPGGVSVLAQREHAAAVVCTKCVEQQRLQGGETSPGLLSDDHSWHSSDFSQVAAMTAAEAFQSGQMEDVSCDSFTPARWRHRREKIMCFFDIGKRRISGPLGEIWRVYLLPDCDDVTVSICRQIFLANNFLLISHFLVLIQSLDQITPLQPLHVHTKHLFESRLIHLLQCEVQ